MCDRENLRHAEVYFENAHCIYASTRDPRDPPDVLPGSGIAIPILHRASPFDLWIAFNSGAACVTEEDADREWQRVDRRRVHE